MNCLLRWLKSDESQEVINELRVERDAASLAKDIGDPLELNCPLVGSATSHRVEYIGN